MQGKVNLGSLLNCHPLGLKGEAPYPSTSLRPLSNKALPVTSLRGGASITTCL